MNSPRLITTVATCLELLFGTPTTFAAESVVNTTPPGGTDLNQALLPPPGFYMAMVGLYASATHTNDFNGNPNPYNASLANRFSEGAVAGLYVYPWQIFGGSLGSVIIPQVIEGCLTNFATAGVPGAPKNCVAGLTDLYADIFLWSKYLGPMGTAPGPNPHFPYGLTIETGLAQKMPLGNYNPNDFYNQSANLWIFIPNFAFTYNTGPNWSIGDSTQVSARFFFGLPLKNAATNYQSGNVFDIDWSVSELFGNWQAGVQGYFQTQISNDIAPGGRTPLNGNRYEEGGIGPVLQYNFPDAGAFIKAKYMAPIATKNNLVEQVFVVTFAIKLL